MVGNEQNKIVYNINSSRKTRQEEQIQGVPLVIESRLWLNRFIKIEREKLYLFHLINKKLLQILTKKTYDIVLIVPKGIAIIFANYYILHWKNGWSILYQKCLIGKIDLFKPIRREDYLKQTFKTPLLLQMQKKMFIFFSLFY